MTKDDIALAKKYMNAKVSMLVVEEKLAISISQKVKCNFLITLLFIEFYKQSSAEYLHIKGIF